MALSIKQSLATIARELRGFLRDSCGLSAVETAALAPIVAGALLIMSDLGLAAAQRLQLNHALRTGAEFAMSDITDLDVIKQNIQAAGNLDPEQVTITSERLCECPGSGASACDTLCTGEAAPMMFIRIAAEQPYDPMLLSTMTLRGEMRVRVR